MAIMNLDRVRALALDLRLDPGDMWDRVADLHDEAGCELPGCRICTDAGHHERGM